MKTSAGPHSLFLAACVFLAGCGSIPVSVDSIPSGAEIQNSISGASMGTTPRPLYVGTYSIRKEGYKPKSISVPAVSGSARNVPPMKVELEKEVQISTITSRPEGGELFDKDGNLLGALPMAITRGASSQAYEVRLFGYNPRKITLTPDSRNQVEVDMGATIPGMMLLQTVVGQNGVEVRSTLVFSEKDVIERSPNVRAVRRLTDFPASRWVGRLALFPDAKRLAVDILDKEATADAQAPLFSNLWALDVAGGGGLQRLTDGKYLDEGPCFSADGAFMYFGSSRAGKNAIFRMSLEKSKGLGLVTPGTTADGYPQVAPDGLTLMWTASMVGSEAQQLWSLPLKDGLPGGLPMQIREGKEPRWSPKGDVILYNAMDRNIAKMKIWTMAPDGSKPTQITTGSNYNDVDPYWTSDGSRIIFSSDRGVSNGKQNYDIWMMGADGSNPQQLTTNGSHDDRPIISPDGRTIYFRSNRGLKWDIWVMELSANP